MDCSRLIIVYNYYGYRAGTTISMPLHSQPIVKPLHIAIVGYIATTGFDIKYYIHCVCVYVVAVCGVNHPHVWCGN